MGGGKRSHGRPGNNLGAALKSAREKKIAGHREIRRVLDETTGITHIHAGEINRREAHLVDQKISSTEPDHVSDFLATVQLANKEFEVLRPEHHKLNIIQPEAKDFSETLEEMSKLQQDILIPRRPIWTPETTKEELDRAEKDAFLKWRRELAEVEEDNDTVFTPFEKNIEFWKQLWRVIERSDLVVQVVDARRPLLYRCADLEEYVEEIGLRQGPEEGRKQNLLLVNKADLVSEHQRKEWANFFESRNIDFIFFSAIEEQEKLDDLKEELREQEEKEADLIKKFSALTDSDEEEDEEEPEVEEEKIVYLPENNYDIYDKDQFQLLVKTLRADRSRFNQDHITVGMVGYPNVGKSSVINVLIQDKKVSVSATPGKTKHFQTLYCGDNRDLMLCDCPGLVFPSTVTTKEELVLAGILPVNHIRDWLSPVGLLVNLIPKNKLEAAYGIAIIQLEKIGENIERLPTAGEFLLPMAAGRGFRTSRGQPDRSRAARLAIKDFLNGRLLFVHPPPTCQDEEYFKEMTIETEKDAEKLEKRLKMVETKMLQTWKLDKVDRAFFSQDEVKAKVYGLTGADGKFQVNTEGKSRLQDLKPRKKDKQRRIREKALRKENVGLPDWAE